MNRTWTIILSVVLVLILVGVSGTIYVLSHRPAGEQAESAADTASVVGTFNNDPGRVRPNDHILGNEKAKVVVIEYASPSCSVCAMWSKEIMPRFKQAYLDTGKVLYVYRFFPLQRFPNDPDVAKMALCLPHEQFFPFVEMMYRNQPEWDQPEYPQVMDVDAALVRMGAIAGMSADKVKECREPNVTVDDEINAIAEAADLKYHITGTPTFVVNGKVVDFNWEPLSAAIDAALK